MEQLAAHFLSIFQFCFFIFVATRPIRSRGLLKKFPIQLKSRIVYKPYIASLSFSLACSHTIALLTHTLSRSSPGALSSGLHCTPNVF
ncbi:hypothetical protein ACOSP7_022293 [Xanthoceras sorbifolium]